MKRTVASLRDGTPVACYDGVALWPILRMDGRSDETIIVRTAEGAKRWIRYVESGGYTRVLGQGRLAR